MDPLKPYTVRPIRGRYLVDGPGSDGIPLTTKAQAEAIAHFMNTAFGAGALKGSDIVECRLAPGRCYCGVHRTEA